MLHYCNDTAVTKGIRFTTAQATTSSLCVHGIINKWQPRMNASMNNDTGVHHLFLANRSKSLYVFWLSQIRFEEATVMSMNCQWSSATTQQYKFGWLISKIVHKACNTKISFESVHKLFSHQSPMPLDWAHRRLKKPLSNIFAVRFRKDGKLLWIPIPLQKAMT